MTGSAVPGTTSRRVLMAVVAAAVLLQFLGLTQDSLWLDELFSIWGSRTDSLAVVVDRLRPDVHPPLYQSILWAWMQAFGEGERATRLLSACFGVAASGACFFGVRRRLGREQAWLATALFAACYTVLLYGRTVRSYEMLLLLSTLFTLAWLGLAHALRHSLEGARLDPHDAAVYALTGLLASGTHFYGALLVGTASLYLMGLSLRAEARPLRIPVWILVVGTGIASLAVLGGWLSMSVAMKEKVSGNFWIVPPDLIFAAKLLRFFAGTVVSGFLIYPLIAWCLWRLRPIAREVLASSDERDEALVACLFLVSVALAIAVLSSYVVPTVTARNMIIVLPAFWIGFPLLVQRALGTDRGVRVLVAMAMATLAISVVRLAASGPYPRFTENEQPREAITFVARRLVAAREVVVVGNNPGGESSFNYWDYYLSRSGLQPAEVHVSNDLPALQSAAQTALAQGRDVAILIGFLRNPEQQKFLALAEGLEQHPGCERWEGRFTLALACRAM